MILTLFASPVLADPSVSVAFSPNAGSTEAVAQAISEARRSIHLAAYSFTSKAIAQALIQAHARGIEVEAVLDRSNAAAESTGAQDLTNGGVPVRIDFQYATMHNKFIVIDGVTVETGSFNFTAAAERHNAENVLVLRDYPDVAARYEGEWQRLWAESRDYPVSEEP